MRLTTLLLFTGYVTIVLECRSILVSPDFSSSVSVELTFTFFTQRSIRFGAGILFSCLLIDLLIP